MVPQLTSGAVQRINSGEDVPKPVLQVLSYKLISNSGNHERYRMLLSDGLKCHTFAMLATQLNERLRNGELEKFTVICLDKYLCNTMQVEKKVLIVLDFSVVATAEEVGGKIGDPVIPSGAGQSASENSAPAANQSRNRPQAVENRNFSSSTAQPQSSFQGGGGGFGSFGRQNDGPSNIHPISSLTPYQNKWTIRVRTTNKSNIRHWSNSRGEGKLFSMDLLDESGEIRATAFNEQCDKFYDMIEVNKVYYISKANLKPANKAFTSIKNEYEMSLNNETIIIPCHEETPSIPSLQFNFTTIDQLQSLAKDAIVDVIGVCKSVGDIQTVTKRATNQELKKRDIHLVDKTNTEVALTLWNVEAEKFDGSMNPVVAVKGARVSDFSGISLSLFNSSMLQINPDIREAHVLRGWYDREGSTLSSQSISLRSTGGMSGVGTNWKTFAQTKSEMLGQGDKPDYYSSKATVFLIKKENCLYMACPSEDCNKKVIDMNNGMYRCEKCNREYPNFKYRLLLVADLTDFSDEQWVTCFGKEAETLLGCSAQDLGLYKETDTAKFDQVINEATFKSYFFKLRTKMEMYNEENRLKTMVVSLNPISYKEYTNKLLGDIAEVAKSL